MARRQILTTIVGPRMGLEKGGALIINKDDGTQTIIEGGDTITVGTSRNFLPSDSGRVLECTATITLTMPVATAANKFPSNFGCAVIPSGTTSIASDGTALLNGATTTITRAAASNVIFAIVPRISAIDSYVVNGS